MTYHSEAVTVYLPVRDESPLSRQQIVEKVRDVVKQAVADLYENDNDVAESLAYPPDVDGSTVSA